RLKKFGILNLEFGMRTQVLRTCPGRLSIPKETAHSPGIIRALSMGMIDEGRLSAFEGGQDIRDRTFAFACRVVKFCEKVYASGGVGRIMVPQLVDCASSCATMLEEARAAESTRDFISKCSISLKEGRESWTRLRVYHACRIGPEPEARE